MFPSSGNGLSFTKVLSGINKSLSIAREIIPLYEQTKPMIQNARKAFSLIKEINVPTKNNANTNIAREKEYKKTTTQSSSPINNPSFFK